MNWDLVAVVCDAMGTAAVVGTLLYLSVQVKLGRIQSEIQSTYASHESYSRWRIAVLNNPELVRSIAKANRKEPLTEEEQILLTTVTNELLIGYIVSAATHQRSRMFYDCHSEVGYIVSILKANPGLIDYWHICRELIRTISLEHVEAIDRKLEAVQASGERQNDNEKSASHL